MINFTDLWYAEASNSEAGDEVALELAEVVASSPFEHREDLLQAEPDLLGPRLVLVLPQRIIREEGLLYGVGELGEDVLLRREANLVAVMNLSAVHATVRRRPAADVGVCTPIRHSPRHCPCCLIDGWSQKGTATCEASKQEPRRDHIGSIWLHKKVQVM